MLVSLIPNKVSAFGETINMIGLISGMINGLRVFLGVGYFPHGSDGK